MILKKSTICISDLTLRTIIGFNEWERNKKQDIIINIKMDFDPQKAVFSDKVEDTLNYKKIKRSIIDLVENSKFNLLEKLTHSIIETVMKNKRVVAAYVKVDKPHALRFAQSVSIEMNAEREL